MGKEKKKNSEREKERGGGVQRTLKVSNNDSENGVVVFIGRQRERENKTII